jgi:RNA polymerase sigma-70 factor (ECF subfamily)
MNERLRIENALHGELDDFNQLILPYQDFLFNLAVRILGDEDMAEDALQETMITAFRKLSAFHGETLKPWLTRILVNVCYDALRSQNRRPTVPLERRTEDGQPMEPGRWMEDRSPGPEEECESRDLVRAIVACLDSLTPNFAPSLFLWMLKTIPTKTQPPY